MKRVSVNADYNNSNANNVPVFIIINIVGMMINAGVNANN